MDVMLLESFPVRRPTLTGCRIWVFDHAGAPGRWADAITSSCPWCGERAPVEPALLDVISGIIRNAGLSEGQSPCLSLPGEAWDEPKLLSECSKCGGKLKFNPFIVDNRELYSRTDAIK